MKDFRLGTTLLALMLALHVIPAAAQLTVDKNRSETSPDQQFGFGINNAGLQIQYAMGPAFHLGMNLNLDVNAGDTLKPSIYHFGPYAKFIFSGGIVKPYLFGAIGVIRPGSGKFGIKGRYQQSDSVYVKLPETELSMRVAVGGEYFFSRNVGIYGHANVVSAILHPAPSIMRFGLLGGVFGLEFFF